MGHAYAALTAERAAGGGCCLLRIEDLDATRARPGFEAAIESDLRWLGLSWSEPVLRQSQRLAHYHAAVDTLAGAGLLYPCFCTRRQIEAEIAQAAQAPHGDSPGVYPGTCREMGLKERARRIAAGALHVLRLDVAAAAERVGPLSFTESGSGPQGETGVIAVDPAVLGDIVLARRAIRAAYHLAVVVDDAFQQVSLVTRGNDLLTATHVQRLLQALLGLPEPQYAHHRLILDAQGRKLSKRDGPVTLRDLRDRGMTAGDVRRQLGF